MTKTKIETLSKSFEKTINKEWQSYLELHDQLTKYGNRVLTDDKEVEDANRILEAIQKKFAQDIYPGIYYIIQKATFANNALTSYNAFIDGLKKAGLSNGKEEPPIMS